MRFAICNETFEGWPHADVCRAVAALGYQGLEVAPFTLAPQVTDLGSGERQRIRREAESCGLQIIALHWLLARTQGLQLTARDAATRRRTAEYLVELARCCRDLGGERLVLGSPKQRQIPPGASPEQAAHYAASTLRRALPGIGDVGVRVCLEPLAPSETDFINTCAEAVAFIDSIGHPGLALHLDVKAMSSERIPTVELIRDYAARANHFHANDRSGRAPGRGDTDFVPILRALGQAGYTGWASIEVFDTDPDPETIAREGLNYLRRCEALCQTGG